ncbi:hypothetical protein [Streptomyces alboflavus]|uniref:hypothetical protein n=1 Tax=Streptomyces alboflavus TaxID=67267 RepID=UPI0030034156
MTGASSGIGEATAQVLAAQGARSPCWRGAASGSPHMWHGSRRRAAARSPSRRM